MTYEEIIDRLSLQPWGICLEEGDGNKTYRRKRKRRRGDLLWKGVLEDVFDDFLCFFFPDAPRIFDLEREATFLDKELQQLFPPEDDQYAPRHVDKLAKVFTRQGKEEYILIHIEVQGYRDKQFPERMFQYYYRVWDKYRRPLTALAILTDPNKQFHPKAFIQEQLGTCLSYSFNTYKLLEQDTAALEQSDNPFVIVLLAARAALTGKKIDDGQLYKLKIRLLKRLLEQEIPKTKIESLLVFLEHSIRFRDKEMDIQFKHDKNHLKERRNTMGVKEALLEMTRLEGEEEGFEKGIRKGRLAEKEQIVKNLIQQMGLSDQQAAEVTEVSVTFVRKVRRKLKQQSVC